MLVTAVAAFGLWSSLVGEPIRTSVWLDLAAAGSAACSAPRASSTRKPSRPASSTSSASRPPLSSSGESASNRGALPWAGGLTLSAYVLVTGLFWAIREQLAAIARTVGMPAPTGAGFAARVRPWLATGNLLAAAVVVALAFWGDFEFHEARLDVPWHSRRSSRPRGWPCWPAASAWPMLKCATIEFGLLGDHRLGLGRASPPGGWLPARPRRRLGWRSPFPPRRASAGGPRRTRSDGEWSTALGTTTPILVAAAIGSVAAMLGFEIAAQINLGSVAMSPVAIAGVVDTARGGRRVHRPGAVGAADRSASPARPRAYVYDAAQAWPSRRSSMRGSRCSPCSAACCGIWPVIVMAVNFAGVGAGEALRRRGRLAVLGRPLAGTGVMLPVLPVVAFWFAASACTDRRCSCSRARSTLLSRWYGTPCGSTSRALAGNAAIWYLLHQHESLGLLVHPQLWVIPAALSVLAAGELNLARLVARPAPRLPLRQPRRGLRLVHRRHLPHTSGVGHSPWLPLVLAAGLSVAGV